MDYLIIQASGGAELRSASLPSSLLATLRCSRRIAVLLSATGLIAPYEIADAQSTATIGPAVEVSERYQDRGTVEQGTIVKYHFTIRNRGQADLEIRKVNPSCGCSVARWDRWIKPGTVGVIEAEMDTLQFRGPVAKHLTVFSNDSETPKLELTIAARVTPLVEITPRPPAQITVDDEAVTQEFTLVRTGGRPMKVLQVTPTAPYLKTQLVPLSGEGSYKLTVTVTPEAPLGRTLNVVVVRTDLPKQPEQTISVLVHRGIIARPPALYWSAAPDGKPQSDRSVVTISRHAGRFQVTGVTSDDPKLQGKVEPVRDGSEYRVTVSYSGNWAPGTARKTLTVTTDDPKQPTLKIPVQVVALTTAADTASPAAP